MTCPFPGMAPYIEVMGLWEGFHAPLVTHCSDVLNQRLPEGYISQIETRVTVPLAIGEVEIRERWIGIKTIPELELVTVIEILSPTNKAGEGREEYLEKRASLIERPVNLVAIDLLLGSRPTPLGKPLPPHHYRAAVARADKRPDAQVYTWTVRHPLPTLPIPLRAPDADVMLNLAEAPELTYRLGRFSMIVRHGTPLPANVPFSPADREWAESLGR